MLVEAEPTAARSPVRSERDLIAAILHTAIADAKEARGGRSAAAYLWLIESIEAPAYCLMLDIDYGQLRARVVALCARRCERLVKLRKEEAGRALMRWLETGRLLGYTRPPKDGYE